MRSLPRWGPRPKRRDPRLPPGSRNAISSDAQRRHAAGLMRVNHTGEVCAQALYSGQAAVARDEGTRAQLLEAAAEETDHLAWCGERLDELSSRPSLLNPLWYAGSFAIGALAALTSDRVSLGFRGRNRAPSRSASGRASDKIPGRRCAQPRRRLADAGRRSASRPQCACRRCARIARAGSATDALCIQHHEGGCLPYLATGAEVIPKKTLPAKGGLRRKNKPHCCSLAPILACFNILFTRSTRACRVRQTSCRQP